MSSGYANQAPPPPPPLTHGVLPFTGFDVSTIIVVAFVLLITGAIIYLFWENMMGEMRIKNG